MYRCPLCQLRLTLHERVYQCANRHSFDIAREGYVNLLPVQQKNSKDPGDNKQMMQARRSFLQSGAYAALAQAVTQQLLQFQPSSLLDCGCGEGYYTAFIAEQLPQCQTYGIDISKAAIKYAAKAHAGIQFSVASAYQLPFADNSFDALVRIYAPSKDTELLRLLRDNGHLVTVTPGPQHLIEIKQAVYDDVRLHDDAIAELQGFKHLNRQRLQYQFKPENAAQLLALLQMVPLAWKFSAEQQQHFANNTQAISIDFLIDSYQRSHYQSGGA